MSDTIVAVATAAGRGGVGVLRVSGPMAAAVVRRLTQRELPAPRIATLRTFHDADGTALDRGLLLWFPAPASYTGEDVAELQAHGGPVLLQALAAAACTHGARHARAGEFTERAFLNGKLDLAQAEAVADLIDAGSVDAARAALRSLDGVFSMRVEALVGALTHCRAQAEAALDFADEPLDGLDRDITARIDTLRNDLATLTAAAMRGRRLRDGITVAIIGRPNVGKSTLLNQLAGSDAAIVAELPGTTRDVLREHLVVDGQPLTVIDTAGLRETTDIVEQEGVRRAWQAVSTADVVLFVIDDSVGVTAEDDALLAQLPQAVQPLKLYNKCDRSGAAPGLFNDAGGRALRLSAATGDGIDVLRAVLTGAAASSDAGGTFTARARHLDALRRADRHLALAAKAPAVELVAEELRLAQTALGEITGVVSSDDLLGVIFASFCIGK